MDSLTEISSNINIWALRSSTMKSKFKDGGYRHARLKNRSTGESQDVLLIPPHELTGEYKNDEGQRTTQPLISENLSVEANSELKVDLTKAFAQFSPLEKRVLHRVLIQGQSIREATKNMKGSLRNWQYWVSREALPKLRKSLKDYFQDGKVVL